MKHITLFILLLIIVSLACGAQPSAGIPTPLNADHLVEFNEAGVAVLRGAPSGGTHSSTKNTIDVSIPVKVEGIQAFIVVPFNMGSETEILSSQVSKTTVREYLNSNSRATPLDAFPRLAKVEVTFLKKGTAFETASVHEIEQGFDLLQKQEVLENVFIKDDVVKQDVLIGSIYQEYKQMDGVTTWLVSVPISIHGVEAAVILPVDSATDTQINTSNGEVPYFDSVRIEFTRSGDKLTARQITELQ
jgi:hypothetical protein